MVDSFEISIDLTAAQRGGYSLIINAKNINSYNSIAVSEEGEITSTVWF